MTCEWTRTNSVLNVSSLLTHYKKIVPENPSACAFAPGFEIMIPVLFAPAFHSSTFYFQEPYLKWFVASENKSGTCQYGSISPKHACTLFLDSKIDLYVQAVGIFLQVDSICFKRKMLCSYTSNNVRFAE